MRNPHMFVRANENYTGRNLTDIMGKLNYERMLFQLPVSVMLSIIMTVSLIGNTLVVCVYKSKYKKRTSNYFILVLAVVDLCSSLCIPFVLFDLSFPFMYPVPILCKINRFMEAWSCTASGLVLVCIAFDRYFHVCYPLRVYSNNQAHSLNIVMLVLAASVAWPILFLAGKRTVPTRIPGLFGSDCSYRDGMHNTVYTFLFQSSLLFTFFVNMCIFSIFYGRIFYVIFKRRQTTIGEQCAVVNRETSFHSSKHRRKKEICNNTVSSIEYSKPGTYRSFEQQTLGHQQQQQQQQNEPEVRNDAINIQNGKDGCKSTPETNLRLNGTCDKTKSKKSHPARSRNVPKILGSSVAKIRTTHTTVMLALVTLAAVLAYMPYLIVSLMINFGHYFKPGMSRGEDIAYEFCSKSYFLNGAANPIIYSALNPAFRRESVAILKKVFSVFHRK